MLGGGGAVMNRLAYMVLGCLALLLLSIFLLRCICLSVRALWLTSEFESDVRRDRDHAGDGVRVRPFTTGLVARRMAHEEKADG
jgi:hypothetical protein